LTVALNEDGTYRDTVFLRVIGPDYIPIAFAAAAKADPNTKLYYNDYNLERPNNKTAGALRIVNLIKSRGVKIDGVGMQAHRTLGGTPSYAEQMAAIDGWTKAGVESAYTEIDIRMVMPATPEKLEQQKREYYNTIRACVDSRRCVGTTVWGPSDKYSWIPGWFEGQGAALPWDENYVKKPAYYGMLEAFTDKKYRY
jgi:endo-1,4-beta-xylanase